MTMSEYPEWNMPPRRPTSAFRPQEPTKRAKPPLPKQPKRVRKVRFRGVVPYYMVRTRHGKGWRELNELEKAILEASSTTQPVTLLHLAHALGMPKHRVEWSCHILTKSGFLLCRRDPDRPPTKLFYRNLR